MTIAEIEARFTGLNRGSSAFAQMEQVLENYQRAHCEIYRRFGEKYLPVSAFKHAEIATFPVSKAEHIFRSSATGSGLRSQHFVKRLAVYEASVCTAFEAAFGGGPYTIWAHLPGYSTESSLVCMLKILIQRYGDERSQFFLTNELPGDARDFASPLIFFGAAFGLLSLLEEGHWSLPQSARIVETGGMKTYQREITRRELHTRLAEGFGIQKDHVWSEYGMCELLSQAYAQGGPVYMPPPWIRVQIVDPYDSKKILPDGQAGLITVTDLANIHTVSSILTEDLGVSHGEGFEVLGRFPGSTLRGCNFLLEDM